MSGLLRNRCLVAVGLTLILALPAAGEVIKAKEKPAAPADAAGVQFPDTVIGRRVAAFFAAFNTGSDERMREFEREHRAASALAARPIEDRIEQFRGLRDEWGEIVPQRVMSVGEHEITVRVESKALAERLTFEFRFEPEPPHKLDAIMIMGFGPGGAGPEVRVDADARRAAIEQIARVMAESYVFPEVGRQMAEAVREKLAAGGYDDLEYAHDLAARLMQDLQAICHDRHVQIMVGSPGCGGDAGDDAPMPGRGPADMRNYGFMRVERMPGNVGYIKLNEFNPTPEAQKTASAAMTFVRHCAALIFDLRDNGGGSPEMIIHLSTYLFDKPTHLNSFYNRAEEKTSESWTRAELPEHHFGAQKPVYVLTSGRTFSGAEEFTYNLKNLKRATIVGATTGGGAHPVRPERIDDTLTILVPYARAINPITKTNWEGTGIEPHVACPVGDALLVAREHALEALLAADPQEARAGEYQRALRLVQREQRDEQPSAGSPEPVRIIRRVPR